MGWGAFARYMVGGMGRVHVHGIAHLSVGRRRAIPPCPLVIVGDRDRLLDRRGQFGENFEVDEHPVYKVLGHTARVGHLHMV